MSKNAVTGFTLVEVLIVLTLLGLTLSIATANFAGGTARATHESEARRLIGLLHQSRTRAMTEGLTNSLLPEDPLNENGLRQGEEFDDLPEGYTVSFSSGNIPVGVSPSGIHFYPDGSSSGGSIILQSTAGATEITVSWLTGEIYVVEDASE